jgi:hypothetical protein
MDVVAGRLLAICQCFQKRGICAFLRRPRVPVTIVLCAGVLIALGLTYLALHDIKPASFRLSAKIARLVSVEMEFHKDRDRSRDAAPTDGQAEAEAE